MEKDKDLLLTFLSDDGGLHLALTCKKFQERGKIVQDARFPEKIVFVVERHRAITGAVYTPGVPMNAGETYRAKYVYDPAANSIDELTSEEVSVGTFVDNDGLASEFLDGFPITVTRHADGKVFTVECSGLCDPFNVTTLTEAESHFKSLLGNFDFDHDVQPNEMKVATIEEGLSRLRKAWKSPRCE